MILEVHERLALMNLLPKQEDYKALKTIRRAREMLSFTPEEMKILNMVTTPSKDGKSSVTWDNDKVHEVVKDCPIDEYTTNLFRDILAELNKNHNLLDETVSLYEKFVVMYK
jgi:hypothetical protein